MSSWSLFWVCDCFLLQLIFAAVQSKTVTSADLNANVGQIREKHARFTHFGEFPVKLWGIYLEITFKIYQKVSSFFLCCANVRFHCLQGPWGLFKMTPSICVLACLSTFMSFKAVVLTVVESLKSWSISIRCAVLYSSIVSHPNFHLFHLHLSKVTSKCFTFSVNLTKGKSQFWKSNTLHRKKKNFSCFRVVTRTWSYTPISFSSVFAENDWMNESETTANAGALSRLTQAP